MKPLGGKAYGHIPHFPGSRMGPGDHHCAPGQETICTVKTRDNRDRVIVTEKLDGSCVAVANIGGEIVALGRAGYLAKTSPYEMHHVFEAWVRQEWDRFMCLLPGSRIVGEWLWLAHGTRYDGTGLPFVPFDYFEGGRRAGHDEARNIFACAGLRGAHVVSDGPAISIPDALAMLGPFGRHGSTEIVEGAVWRVERGGEFDFLAKYVRPDKTDGKYLPGVNGNPEGRGIVMFPGAVRKLVEEG